MEPSSSVLRIRANAKINLTLDITGRRPDGYHTLSMVMQSIALHDRVTLSLGGSGIRVFCDDPALPCGEENLAYRAADAFFAASGIQNPGVSISIEKQIPAQAGLAGGSADAAAVLFGLNQLLGRPLQTDALTAAGASVGADVPFCLTGGTRLVQGIGDILSPLPAIHPFPIVLVKPPFSSSTAEAYRAANCASLLHPSAEPAAKALQSGNLAALSAALGNSFESIVAPEEIAVLKRQFREYGALGSAMSGSGTAVFGLFDSPCAAEMCRRSFAQQFRDVFLTFPVHRGVEPETVKS